MKLTTGISGCALVAGLMTFASGNAHAKNLVIDNTLYAPFNLKLSTVYNDGKKLKKASMTSKEFLKDHGYDTGKVRLAVNMDTFEVWVVNGDSLIANLSTNDTLYIDYDTNVYAQKGDKDSYKEAGIFYVYSEPDVEAVSGESVTPATAEFGVSGIYSESYSYGKVNKDFEYNYKVSLKAKNMSGWAYVPDLSDSDLPASGSASFKGSGKLVD